MIEIINSSASPIEIGKNAKLGEGEPLELHVDEVVTNGTRANREEPADSDSRSVHDVYHVREIQVSHPYPLSYKRSLRENWSTWSSPKEMC